MKSKFSPLLLKYLLFFFIPFLSFSARAQMRQMSVGAIPDNEIHKISFYSPSQGFIAYRDWVGFTTDSGRTFTKKYITPGNINYNGNLVNLTFGFWIEGIKAFDQNKLLLCGHFGLEPTILYSNDGGNSWTVVYWRAFSLTAANGGITDMIFPQDGTTGYACDLHSILKTTNGGLSWNIIAAYPNSHFTNLVGLDNSNLYAISTYYASNKIIKTTNGGAAWSNVTIPGGTNAQVEAVYFRTANKGWVSIEDNNHNHQLHTTNDGGSSFSLLNDPEVTSIYLDHLKFFTDQIGYALGGDLYTVQKTVDGGKTWEPLPRDNNFSYLGYGHNDLHFWSTDQFWAGGGYGFLEMTSNGGGTPLPKAYFKIDTTNLSTTGVVNLLNYSRNTYQYKWYRNDTLFSTSYNTSYTHGTYRAYDTIKLVVINGAQTDTLVKYQYFNIPPLPQYPGITSFSPQTGVQGDYITITGVNFTNTNSVKFGGIPSPGFTVISPTQIRAEVGTGGSGDITVTTAIGTASTPGFTFTTKLRITSFSPKRGEVGSNVTITGNNFSTVPENNIVYFGPVKATVIAATSTQIIAKVPAGTNYQPISVTTNKLTAYSSLPFATTFAEGGAITSSSFSQPVAYPADENSSLALATADIDGDGKPDVLSGSTGLDRITIYRNISEINSLSLEYKTYLINTPGLGGLSQFVVADINGDGKLDVTFSNSFGGITVYPNTSVPGQISFGPGKQFASPEPYNLTYGDIDGDGKTDLIGSAGDGKIVYFKNISTENNISFAYVQLGFGYSGNVCKVGDVDNDGRPDIIALYTTAVTIYKNTSSTGALSFVTPGNAPSFPVPNAFLYDMTVGDLDGDDKIDVAVKDGNGIIYVLRNTSAAGSISFATPITFSMPNARTIKVEDLNGDGKPELCGSIFNSIQHPSVFQQVGILENKSVTGTLDFAPVVNLFTQGVDCSTNFLNLCDMDGDGKSDVIANVGKDNTITYFINRTGDSTLLVCQGVTKSLVTPRSGATYQWQQNTGGGFVNLSDNADFSGTTTSSLQIINLPASWNGYRYRCLVNGTADRPFVLKIQTAQNPSVTISKNVETVCATANVTFTASTINGGAHPVYLWKLNGVDTGNNSSTFSLNSLKNGDNVQVKVTSGSTCANNLTALSNIITVPVVSLPSTSVTISTPINPICEGQNAVFTATAVDAGTNPTYKWYIDFAQVGTNSNIFSTTTLPVTDRNVKCIVTGSNTCAITVTSNIITMGVKVNETPTCITLQSPNGVVCTGTTLTFSASFVSGEGPTPYFQWIKNSVNVGTNSRTYVDNSLRNADTISLIMTSSAQCITKTSTRSGVIVRMDAILPPQISISGATNVNQGANTTLTINPVNNGANTTYQWQDSTSSAGWTNIGTATTAVTFQYKPVQSGNKIRCIMNANSNCSSPNTATSFPLTFTVNAVTAIDPVAGTNYGMRLYPNPVYSDFTIDTLKISDKWQSLEIVSLDGKHPLLKKIISNQTRINMNLRALPNGVYMAVLRKRSGEVAYFRLLKM